MDFSVLVTSLQATLGEQLPAIFFALVIIIVGWLVAVVLRAGTRRLLGMLHVDKRIEESTGQKVGVETGIAIGVFWLVILVTVVAVFNSLHLERISDPFAQLVTQIIGYAPRLIAGTVLTLLAWLIATVIQAVVNKALAASKLGATLSKEAGMEPMSKTVANVLFWLVILLFVPSILAAFDLRGLLEPVQGMLSKLLDMVPTLIGALDALKVEAISRPATEMLERLLAAVPNLVAAALILVVTWYVAKFAADVLSRLLAGMGLDTVPEKLSMSSVFSGAFKPSAMVRWLALFFAMLFATVEAANRLDFSQVR